MPVKFLRDVYEGGHVINQKYEFNHAKRLVFNQTKLFEIPNDSQDMLSAFFYARTFNKENVLLDSVFPYLFLWMMKIIFKSKISL